MVSTPPSLLWEWVNAKHTGGVPNQSCPPPCPCTAGQWICFGAKAYVPLLLLRQGLGVPSKALAALPRLCSLWVDYRSLRGDLTAKLFPTLPSLSLC